MEKSIDDWRDLQRKIDARAADEEFARQMQSKKHGTHQVKKAYARGEDEETRLSEISCQQAYNYVIATERAREADLIYWGEINAAEKLELARKKQLEDLRQAFLEAEVQRELAGPLKKKKAMQKAAKERKKAALQLRMHRMVSREKKCLPAPLQQDVKRVKFQEVAQPAQQQDPKLKVDEEKKPSTEVQSQKTAQPAQQDPELKVDEEKTPSTEVQGQETAQPAQQDPELKVDEEKTPSTEMQSQEIAQPAQQDPELKVDEKKKPAMEVAIYQPSREAAIAAVQMELAYSIPDCTTYGPEIARQLQLVSEVYRRSLTSQEQPPNFMQ